MTRNARLNPRAATGEVIPTSLNASALRDTDGNVIGAIGVLRDMRAYEAVVRDLEESKTELQGKILDLEKFEEVVVGRELKMIALEKDLETLQQENTPGTAPGAPPASTASGTSPLPPLPVVDTASTHVSDQALQFVRLAISAAHADGSVSDLRNATSAF